MKHVTVPVPADRQARADAGDDPRLEQLLNATPAQIDAWLDAHVTSLDDARKLFRSILLALRYLYRRGG